MSFGKQDAHLANIGGYGATSSQQMGNASRRQSGPRKGLPSWANNFSPNEGQPDSIRLIPGEYDAERINATTGEIYSEKVPWMEFTEHFHATNKKSIICSAGIHRDNDWKKAQPCRGCDIWREDLQERQRIERETGVKPQGPKRMSKQTKYAFLVLDMGDFFKGFRLDERGQPRSNSSTGQRYTDWIKYFDPSQPEYVLAYHESVRTQKPMEWKHGLIQSWPVGYGQFNVISGYVDLIQRHCRSCGGMECLHTSTWVCPFCSAPTFQAGASTLPQDEVKKLVNQIKVCTNCNQQAYPKAVTHCRYCQNPVPANLYDVDLRVYQTRVNKTPQLQIPWSSQPKAIDPSFTDSLAKIPELVKKFAPTPYEEQVTLFGQPTQQMQAVAPPQQQWVGGGYPQAPAFAQPPPPMGYGQPHQQPPPLYPPQPQYAQQPQYPPPPQQPYQPQYAPQQPPQPPQPPQQYYSGYPPSTGYPQS